MKRSTIIFFVFTLMSTAATSQEKPPAQYQETTTYNFDDEPVLGDIARPDGSSIVSRPHPASHSLIRLRAHFVDKMVRAIEDL